MLLTIRQFKKNKKLKNLIYELAERDRADTNFQEIITTLEFCLTYCKKAMNRLEQNRYYHEFELSDKLKIKYGNDDKEVENLFFYKYRYMKRERLKRNIRWNIMLVVLSFIISGIILFGMISLVSSIGRRHTGHAARFIYSVASTCIIYLWFYSRNSSKTGIDVDKFRDWVSDNSKYLSNESLHYGKELDNIIKQNHD